MQKLVTENMTCLNYNMYNIKCRCEGCHLICTHDWSLIADSLQMWCNYNHFLFKEQAQQLPVMSCRVTVCGAHLPQGRRPHPTTGGSCSTRPDTSNQNEKCFGATELSAFNSAQQLLPDGSTLCQRFSVTHLHRLRLALYPVFIFAAPLPGCGAILSVPAALPPLVLLTSETKTTVRIRIIP